MLFCLVLIKKFTNVILCSRKRKKTEIEVEKLRRRAYHPQSIHLTHSLSLKNGFEPRRKPKPRNQIRRRRKATRHYPPFLSTSRISVSDLVPNLNSVSEIVFSSSEQGQDPYAAHSSLTHLSLSCVSPSPCRSISFKSTIAANPLQSPLSIVPRRPVDPSSAAALRRASVVWFRNDLRVHDNECLNSANDECVSVLPVYCFDPRDYGKSSSGFDKTGPFRAQFLIESVSELRKSLQARGSNLVVRVGKPEAVLAELAKEIGADAVYAHREVSHDEVKAEGKIETAMKEEGVEVKYFWGSTLYHLDDLPFKIEDLPSNYGAFKDKVHKLEIRKTIAALDQLKSLPSRGDVELGDIPSLLDLGISLTARTSQEGKPTMVGGETEALTRLKSFAAECQVRLTKGNQKGGNNSVYGANFSCKISPWLAMGSISPRSMFDELKKTISASTTTATPRNGPGDTGLNWLMYELLWRDFFRFITKKYSSMKTQVEAGPATACTGAFA